MAVICKTRMRCKGFLLGTLEVTDARPKSFKLKACSKNAGEVGYGMSDYELLGRIVTLERKLGMPATIASWKPLMSEDRRRAYTEDRMREGGT
eukprot:jgi/Botrbrau1/12856/Bobra.0045s0025.1